MRQSCACPNSGFVAIAAGQGFSLGLKGSSGGGCEGAADCSDGLFCNGVENCVAGQCVAGSDPCPGQSCDEDNDVCVAGASEVWVSFVDSVPTVSIGGVNIALDAIDGVTTKSAA